jgi:hypothetical protein
VSEKPPALDTHVPEQLERENEPTKKYSLCLIVFPKGILITTQLVYYLLLTNLIMVATPGDKQCEVVLVGCGAPKRGMGWYHAVQMLKGKCPSAKMCYVVEPWFLGGGASGPGGPEFAEWQKEAETEDGVVFLKSVAELPPVTDGKKRLALISGRTADNPSLLTQCIASNCSVIYLEKPGAPTVAELEKMRDEPAAAGVTVKMGYNKNVCKYVTRAREFAEANDGSHVTFVSNNAYENTPESLGECFERNREGMLKNMAIHELALLVSFFGLVKTLPILTRSSLPLPPRVARVSVSLPIVAVVTSVTPR